MLAREASKFKSLNLIQKSKKNDHELLSDKSQDIDLGDFDRQMKVDDEQERQKKLQKKEEEIEQEE